MISFNRRAEALSLLLKEKLGLRHGNLATRLTRARRDLPKRLRHAGEVIIKAQKTAAHPRLRQTISAGPVEDAFKELTRYLNDIDPKERRKTALLRWLSAQVASLLILGVAVVLLLRWQNLL